MSSLKAVALEDVADIFNGKTPSKAEQRGTGYPVLKIKDVNELGEFRGTFESFVDSQLAETFASKQVRDGDTLILNAAHNADYVGSKTYRAQPPTFGALATGEWLIVRPAVAKLHPGFAHYWVNNPSTKRTIRDMVKGIHLYPKDVARLRIPLPPLPEQRRIAEVLDKADALRAKRRAALAQLDTLTQAIFLDMFGDPATNPKGWPSERTLGEVAGIVSGVTKGRKLDGKATRLVPYLAVVNVQDRALDLSVIKYIQATEEEIQRYLVRPNDLLLTEGGDPDKLGRGTLWKGELAECIHQNHVFRVRLTKDELDPLYLNWLVGSSRGKRYFLRSAKQTTGIASINMTQLRGFPLLVPPLELQREFTHRAATVEELKASHRASLTELGALFTSLQDRAFREAL